MKITEVIITAERIVFGMYANTGIRNPRASKTTIPVKIFKMLGILYVDEITYVNNYRHKR